MIYTNMFAKNQYEINNGHGCTIFRSYDTDVVRLNSCKKVMTFTEWWMNKPGNFWTVTTRKYLREFMSKNGMGYWGIKQIRDAVAAGEFERFGVKWKVVYKHS